jgi:hypothetical protein
VGGEAGGVGDVSPGSLDLDSKKIMWDGKRETGGGGRKKANGRWWEEAEKRQRHRPIMKKNK